MGHRELDKSHLPLRISHSWNACRKEKTTNKKQERAKFWRGWQTTVSMILSSICRLCVCVKEEGWGLRRICLWKSEKRCRGGKGADLSRSQATLPWKLTLLKAPVVMSEPLHTINSFLYSSWVGTSCPHHPTGQGGEKKPPNPSRFYQQLSCSLSLNQHSCLCYRQRNITLIKQCHTRWRAVVLSIITSVMHLKVRTTVPTKCKKWYKVAVCFGPFCVPTVLCEANLMLLTNDMRSTGHSSICHKVCQGKSLSVTR